MCLALTLNIFPWWWAIPVAILENWWYRRPENTIILQSNSKTIIWGLGGAGKSELAKTLGQKYKIPVIHLFGFGWRLRPKDEIRAALSKIIENKGSWIMEGLLIDGVDVCRYFIAAL